MFTLDKKSYSKAKTKIISSYRYNKYLKTKVFNAKTFLHLAKNSHIR